MPFTTAEIATTLYYTPREANGLTDADTAEITVPGGQSVTYEDVLGQLFGRSGADALEVASPVLVVATRTGTPAAGGGTYGQGVTPILPEQVLESVGTQMAVAGGVVRKRDSNGYTRSNLALNEVWGEPATAEVELLDSAGSSLGSKTVALPPYGNMQINDLVKSLAGVSTLQDGQIRVRLSSGPGKVAAALFIVDRSNDPATIPVVVR